MYIPLVDLKAQYLSIKEEIDAAIQYIIDNTAFVMGAAVEKLELDFADLCGVDYGIGVGSGTAALALALMAYCIGPGDEVITTANTFMATAEAITHVGARPVFVDIQEASYNINPELLVDAITPSTKAILPVHLFGQPADMDHINRIAQSWGLIVIEDAAQAHGAMYKDKPVGSLGETACFSFYPSKNLGAYGDAGMVVTNDKKIAEQVRRLRDHGRTEKYIHETYGFNSRIDALQAAILNVKLPHLAKWTACRRENAVMYNELLSDICKTPTEMSYAKHVYHVYAVQIPERDEVRNSLKTCGVSTGLHYPVPVHLQPVFKRLGYSEGDFPVTEQFAANCLSLPMYAELTEQQIRYIVSSLSAYG